MNIPQTGKSPNKAAFFKEIALAFEFLSLYHSLNSEKQAELMEQLTYLQATKDDKL